MTPSAMTIPAAKKLLPFETGTIHFVGIGGIGMSGMAEILHNLGYAIQGSNDKETERVQALRAKGIHATVGHSADNILDTDGNPITLLVVSAAIPLDNPELVAARAKHIPIVGRAAMLNQIMSLKWSIGVAGTHGKTTTTTMVTAMLEGGDFDPTVINGGIIEAYDSNARLGQGDWLVAEACEAYGSIFDIHPTVGVVTNVESDHLNYYRDLDDIKAAFRGYLQNLPFYGFGVVCLDDEGVRDVLRRVPDRRIYTYGTTEDADAYLSNIQVSGDSTSFTIRLHDPYGQRDDLIIEKSTIKAFGQHNILNAAAAVTIGWQFGMNERAIRKGLELFVSPDRRFSIRGTVQGVTIIDNFSNHPTEIAATLRAARDYAKGTATPEHPTETRRIHAIYETTALSLNDHLDGFIDCFDDADFAYITPIMKKHKLDDGHHPEDLMTKIKASGRENVTLLETFDATVPTLAPNLRAGDIIVGIGIYDMVSMMKTMPDQLASLDLPVHETKKNGTHA